jgi:RimJ/RimL family protein N-acetyltransferase
MLPVMEIRPAEAADKAGYIELYSAVAAEGRWIGGEAPVDQERLGGLFDQTLASDQSTLLVAIEPAAGGTDDIVGAIFLRVDGGVVGLGMMVSVRRRGRGLGRGLLDAGIDWSRTIGAHKVALEVWPHNAGAIALYRRSGFAVEGRRARHHRRRSGELWDAIVMGLTLDTSSPGSPHPDSGNLASPITGPTADTVRAPCSR